MLLDISADADRWNDLKFERTCPGAYTDLCQPRSTSTLLPLFPSCLQAPSAQYYAISSDEHAFGLFSQPQGPETRDLAPIEI